MIPFLEIDRAEVVRGGRPVLTVENFSIAEKETLAVVGPNGAGKSTLLLLLAHILPPVPGNLRLRGEIIEKHNDLAYRRKIALVLQDALLLDGTVLDNVAAGLYYRGLAAREITERAAYWLGQFGIASLAPRRSRSLSGGEAQRVSLARAFAISPEILLLDEPFSNLDAPTRAHLLQDFQSIIAATRTTAVFVTHDLDEALMLGSRLAVMMGGEIRQIGKPEEVLNAPLDAETAAFVGVESILSGQVVRRTDGIVCVDVNGRQVEAVGDIETGRGVYLCLRPEDVTLWGGAAVPTSARNCLPGVVQRITPQGPLVRVELDCGFPLVALITRLTCQEMGVQPGREVAASFKASAIHIIPR